jgi:hypothetical protein
MGVIEHVCERRCSVDGSMNASKFLAYVEQYLVSILKRQDIVVYDKLSAHQGPAEAIEARGATLCYLPRPEPEMPFQHAEDISEQVGRTNNFPPASAHWHVRAQSKRPGSLQLFQARRLCVEATGICSSAAPVGQVGCVKFLELREQSLG